MITLSLELVHCIQRSSAYQPICQLPLEFPGDIFLPYFREIVKELRSSRNQDRPLGWRRRQPGQRQTVQGRRVQRATWELTARILCHFPP